MLKRSNSASHTLPEDNLDNGVDAKYWIVEPEESNALVEIAVLLHDLRSIGRAQI